MLLNESTLQAARADMDEHLVEFRGVLAGHSGFQGSVFTFLRNILRFFEKFRG